MYYILKQKIKKTLKDANPAMGDKEFQEILELKQKNTFILALDGDVDFKPTSLKKLIERMKRDEHVGAVCGRIHPIGSGQ